MMRVLCVLAFALALLIDRDDAPPQLTSVPLSGLLVPPVAALQTPGLRAVRAPAAARAPAASMDFFKALTTNFKQLNDRRVAKVSHCLLAAGTDLTLEQANAKIEAWKQEIGNDAEKFAEVCKRESEDPTTAAEGGSLGFLTRARMQTTPGATTLMDLVFQEEDVVPVEKGGTGGVVRGPVGTKLNGKAGLSLVYVHSCWEPTSSGGAMKALTDEDREERKKDR
jgi:hypothetical protein